MSSLREARDELVRARDLLSDAMEEYEASLRRKAGTVHKNLGTVLGWLDEAIHDDDNLR